MRHENTCSISTVWLPFGVLVPFTVWRLRRSGNYFCYFEVRSFEVSRNPPWTYTCKVNHGNFDPLLTTFFSLKFEVRDISTIDKKNIIGNFDENDVYKREKGSIFLCVLCHNGNGKSIATISLG